jgi:hypothetical protein
MTQLLRSKAAHFPGIWIEGRWSPTPTVTVTVLIDDVDGRPYHSSISKLDMGPGEIPKDFSTMRGRAGRSGSGSRSRSGFVRRETLWRFLPMMLSVKGKKRRTPIRLVVGGTTAKSLYLWI